MGPTEKLDLRTTQSDIAVLEEKGFILDKIIGEGSYAKVSGPIYRIRKITFLLYYQDVPARVYSSNCLRAFRFSLNSATCSQMRVDTFYLEFPLLLSASTFAYSAF